MNRSAIESLIVSLSPTDVTHSTRRKQPHPRQKNRQRLGCGSQFLRWIDGWRCATATAECALPHWLCVQLELMSRLASSLSRFAENKNKRLHASLSSASETMLTLELEFILHSQLGISEIVFKERLLEISAQI